MWLLTLLCGFWCSNFITCIRSCNCLTNSTQVMSLDIYCICCANKETSNTPSQTKKGIWCSDISSKLNTQSEYISSLYSTKYYCQDYMQTPVPPRTPQITPPRTCIQECKNKDTCKSKIKFNVLMSVLGFILNE